MATADGSAPMPTAAHRPTSRPHAWLTLSWWARPWLTAAFFVVTALSAIAVTRLDTGATAIMWPPFALLVVNLLAAIVDNPRFRADVPLLLFHLALLALVALFAAGRLTYLEGRVMLTQQVSFPGVLDEERRGPLHGDGVRSLRFMNAGITEVYPKLDDFRHTYNTVMWWDDSGRPRMTEIGDDRPLILQGYRIFTSKHRGVSPILRWTPTDGGPPESGSLQLGQTTQDMFENAVSWHLPDGREAWVSLVARAPQAALPTEQVDMGVYEFDHVLVLRVGDQRHELRKGGSVDLGSGRLTYERLLTWMGYRVVYDPTVPWIVATIGIGLSSMIWFYIRRVFARPLVE